MPRRAPKLSSLSSKSPSAVSAEGDLAYLGVGLRGQHMRDAQAEGFRARTRIRWFEVISENLMDLGTGTRRGGREACERLRRDFAFALHGTSLSLGGTDPFSKPYLKELAELVRRLDPFVVSDHLCWSGVGGAHGHDLFPLPYRESVLKHVAARIQTIQELLKRPIAVENVSSYLEFTGRDWSPEYSEWEFLRELTRRTGCQLLLDVNNVYVSSINHGFDAEEFLHAIPSESVAQMHIAGHSRGDRGLLIDTHIGPVPAAVWDLYEHAIRIHGPRPTLLEWDAEIPSLARLESEILRALPALRTTHVQMGSRHESQALAAAVS